MFVTGAAVVEVVVDVDAGAVAEGLTFWTDTLSFGAGLPVDAGVPTRTTVVEVGLGVLADRAT